MTRPFRTEESIHAERITRDAVAPFLAACGFQDIDESRHVSGSAITQLISASMPQGQRVRMRVRLCWRRRSVEDLRFSAAQLRARLIDDNWDTTLQKIMQRDLEQGVTHNLILQRDGAVIVYAALIPSNDLKGIFDAQAKVSQELIDSGQMKNIKKNHAKNGNSPTVYLMDQRTSGAHQVADVLWKWPGVVDLVKLPMLTSLIDEDAMDDCPPLIDYSMLGTDAPVQRPVLRAEYPRDRRVRAAVLKRTHSCERHGCMSHRTYNGFLDVHHILGVKMGDRVWNCVALCPNCHRDAHFSPETDSINLELLRYAEQFKPIDAEGALNDE
ncbi:HNH endonuclease signature motif containing protein [Pseudomonas sp. fls2-241-R2A-110]|uniref:HNH endonuclease signature motif containing protein n=1 Tax=Pseudomonas sp. fls2-241-R2A-110 TaxID=3040311 RepID=UPI002556799A|nr:HNH endonuclease signature motif containing protein [Pseudomonas sp. fls2-241-R2A-110]